MNRQAYFCLLLLWSLLLGRLAAQELDENSFARYTSTDGLSHNAVSGILQDSTGYLWISTSFGLNRYNGSRFVQFHSNSDSLSLAAEEIPGMVWLDKRRLAVFAGGLHIIDTRTGNTRNLFIPYHDRQFQYKFNVIEAAMGDGEGNIFILARSGFYHFDRNYKLVSRFDYYSEEDVPLEHFFFGRWLYRLDEQRLMIVSIAGLYIYDIAKKQVKKMQPDDCPLMAQFLNYPGNERSEYMFFQPRAGSFFVMQLAGDSIYYVDIKENRKIASLLPIKPLKNEFQYRTRLMKMDDSLFYLTGHSSGFFKLRFYPRTGAITIDPQKYFHSYLCTAVLKDRDNKLWIATNKGLLREDPEKSLVKIAHIPPGIEDSLPNIMLDDVYVSADRVYVGTWRYGGLLVYDKSTLRFSRQLLEKNYSGGKSIYAISAVDSSSLLLGTGGPLFLFNMRSEKMKPVIPPRWDLSGDWTSDLCKDSKGNVWISAYNVYRYNPILKSFTLIPANERLLTVPFEIEEDRDGNIWMSGHGLARYNTVKNGFDLLLDSFPSIKMPDKQVNAMVIDQKNTIWFNPNNNGLIAYHIGKGTFDHYTRSNGLPDDNIASMIVIGERLWMACFSGIACMDLRTSQIVSFGKEDGFPDMPVGKGARLFYDAPSKQLYIAFARAIVRFDPFEILRKRPPPHIFIENLSLNGQKNYFLPERKVTTSWRNNEIMITIGNIDFTDGNNQRFAYRILKSGNAAWQPLGSQPTFNISNLSPGEYTIQVKSYSPNNRWTEQIKDIVIVVLPPFWQKAWFIVLLFVITLLLLYLFVHWRTGLARKKEMEKTQIERLKADDYKNQFELEQISNYFSSSLAGKKTEEEVLWDVAGNLIGRMNYEDCMIYVWNQDKTKMIQKASFGPKGKPEYIHSNIFDVLPGQGVVGFVMETKQPVLVPDTRKDSRYRVDDLYRLSEIAVPIIHNGELLGVIDSEHHEVNYFKERDLNILTTIAMLIGNKLKQIESERTLEAKGKELANINEQLAEARLAALQAQMNPHFVFNALNSIKRMILDGDNERASRYLSKFALMIRMTLNHSKDTFVTLDENIEYLKTYLEMERLRFDDSFSYSISAGENIDLAETVIPSMMIQPLVENAIWHGLMPSGNKKKITIHFTQDQNRITCTIEDNGIGIRQSEKLKAATRPLHNSVGLENIQKRIKIMNEKYDTDCSLQITDMGDNGNNKTGTKVVLRLNVINI